MPHAILLASLISLFAIADASAQPTPATTDGFAGLVAGRTIHVTDTTGYETRARLLRFTPDTLTVAANGGELVFDRKNVATVFERGNSVKKGLVIGLLSGPALAIAAMATGGAAPVNTGELAAGALIFSAFGAAIGTAIDAMIPGKRLVYKDAGAEERTGRTPVTISLNPSLSRGRLGLSTGVSW